MDDGPMADPGGLAERLQVDVMLAEEAVRSLLKAFGLQEHEEIMRNTPRRFVAAYVELFARPAVRPATFPNEERHKELILVRGIEFRSICQDHLLPFTGQASVGYLPGDRVVGPSAVARLVALHAGRPQRQERLTDAIADSLHRYLRPHGVGVLVAGHHLCMTLRGATATGSTTISSAFRGLLREKHQRRAEFLGMVTRADANRERSWSRRPGRR